jgi:hypothetical protein
MMINKNSDDAEIVVSTQMATAKPKRWSVKLALFIAVVGLLIFSIARIYVGYYFSATQKNIGDKINGRFDTKVVGCFSEGTAKPIVLLYNKKTGYFNLWLYDLRNNTTKSLNQDEVHNFAMSDEKAKNFGAGKQEYIDRGYIGILPYSEPTDEYFFNRTDYIHTAQTQEYYPNMFFGAIEKDKADVILVNGKRPHIEIINYAGVQWAFWYTKCEKGSSCVLVEYKGE